MSEKWMDRILNLKDETDRNYFLKKLETRRNLPVTVHQIEEAIIFLQDRLDGEWLTLYPFHTSLQVIVKTGAKMQQTLDFFSVVLRVGFALFALRDLAGFDNLVSRLNHHSYDCLSVILEVLSAARYMIAGYDVELQPATREGRFCDFRVRSNEEWIYFECKKENPIESKYFKKHQKYVDNLVNSLLLKVGGKVPPTHRIDIMLHRQPKIMLSKLVGSISDCLDVGQFGKWKRMDDIEFAVNPRKLRIQPPAELTVAGSRVMTQTTPRSLAQLRNIQVFYDPYGNKELQKARHLIRDAMGQLALDSKSIIVLESFHPKRMVKIAEEKLKQAGYENVVAILLVGDLATGNERSLTLNTSHLDFPLDFLTIAISPNPI